MGDGPGGLIDYAGWPGPQSPNASVIDFKQMTSTCGSTTSTGCLFNVWQDPSERHNLASTEHAVFHSMLREMAQVNTTVYSPTRGKDDPRACTKASSPPQSGGYGGFWGPFLP